MLGRFAMILGALVCGAIVIILVSAPELRDRLVELDAGYDRLFEFVVISSEEGVNWFRRAAPALKAVSVESTKQCFKEYMLYGWSGIFPEACSGRPY